MRRSPEQGVTQRPPCSKAPYSLGQEDFVRASNFGGRLETCVEIVEEYLCPTFRMASSQLCRAASFMKMGGRVLVLTLVVVTFLSAQAVAKNAKKCVPVPGSHCSCKMSDGSGVIDLSPWQKTLRKGR